MKSIQELANLTGRKALITGGAGHIGFAVAQALVEMGATTSLLDCDQESLKKKVSLLEKIKPHSAFSVVCDLHDEKITKTSAKKAVKELGGLDILIHAAGYVGTSKAQGWGVPFEKQQLQAWDNALRVNLSSIFLLVQETKNTLKDSGHGSIVFISSVHGIVAPNPKMYEGTEMVSPAGYSASKGALVQMGRYLATELAPHIRVNTISPGGVFRNQPEIFHERYKNQTPLGRMATEEDIKGATIYLASDLSSYVTGHNLVVDGGYTIW